MEGFTLLYYAIFEENLEYIEKLLIGKNPPIDIRAETNEGRTAFFLACSQSSVPLAMIELFLKYDKDLVHFVDNNDESPLIAAVYHNRLDIVEKIIDAGADVNYKDGNGETALHFATKLGHLEIVYFLLHMTDCDATITNNEGLDPLSVFGRNMERNSRYIGIEMEECIKILFLFTYNTPMDVEDYFAIENYQFEEVINGLCQSILSNYQELTKFYMDAHYSALVNNKAYFIDLLNEAADPSKRDRIFYLLAILMHEKLESIAVFPTDEFEDDVISKIKWNDIFEMFLNMIDNETFDIFLPELMSKGIILSGDNILSRRYGLNTDPIDLHHKDPNKLKKAFKFLFQFGFNVYWVLNHYCIYSTDEDTFYNRTILNMLMPLTIDFYFDDLIHQYFWSLIGKRTNQLIQLVQDYGSKDYYNLLSKFKYPTMNIKFPSLKHLCRYVIRSNSFNKHKSTLIQVERLLALDLPTSLKKYILYDYSE